MCCVRVCSTKLPVRSPDVRAILTTIVVFLSAATLLASTPPTTPTRVPLLEVPTPIPIVPPPHVGPILPWTADRISQLPISPSVATVWINALTTQRGSLSTGVTAIDESTVSQTQSRRPQRFVARVETSLGPVLQLAYDDPLARAREKEPVLISEN